MKVVQRKAGSSQAGGTQRSSNAWMAAKQKPNMIAELEQEMAMSSPG
jgi:hypothetical protein